MAFARAGFGGVQVLQVDEILAASGSSLHRTQILHRADRHVDSMHLGLGRARAELFEARHAVEALDDVEATEVGVDRHLLAACQLCRDREWGTKQRLSSSDVAAGRNRDLGYEFEVLGIGRNDDVYVLGASDDTPGIEGETPIRTKSTPASESRRRS